MTGIRILRNSLICALQPLITHQPSTAQIGG
jgi:hypothetical protein